MPIILLPFKAKERATGIVRDAQPEDIENIRKQIQNTLIRIAINAEKQI